MSTRHLCAGAGAAAIALMLVAGCGTEPGPSPVTDAVGTPSESTGDSTSATTSGRPGIEHPAGPDDVVLRIVTGGGLVPVEYAFTNQPLLLLTGDGRLLVPPEPRGQGRLIAMEVAQLDEEQVQELLSLADDAGLLSTPPDYTDTQGVQIADAPTTTVSLATSAGTWEHEAYALGYDDESGPRSVLSSFVDAVTAAVADLEVEPFVPDAVALYVQPTDVDREVVAWPADDVVLRDTTGCRVVPAAGLVELLSAAGPVTSFRQEDALYSVSAAEVLPGSEPCAAW